MKMKKAVLMLSLVFLLITGGIGLTFAQEKPAPQKDTVNIDTDAKPEFYYAVEDEKSDAKSGNTGIILAIAGGVVVLGAAGYFLLKKKK